MVFIVFKATKGGKTVAVKMLAATNNAKVNLETVNEVSLMRCGVCVRVRRRSGTMLCGMCCDHVINHTEVVMQIYKLDHNI